MSDVDVLVMGSGAAGLLTACVAADAGLRVEVHEKAARLGGTSAVSGGVIWAPANRFHREGPDADTDVAALDYLRAATSGTVPEGRLRWYVATVNTAVDYLVERTHVRLTALTRPDYHPEWPGASKGRSLDNLPFGGARHRGMLESVRPPTYFPAVTMAERDGATATGLDPGVAARREAEGTRTMGGALVGALLASAGERGVVVRADSRVVTLDQERDEWAVGLADGRCLMARAVVLASGGFEWSQALQTAFLPVRARPISAPSNTGDGLVLGLRAGAAVTSMTAVWGVPVVADPDARYDGHPTGRMANVELTLPGSVLVDGTGRRFVNEAGNYHDLNKVFRTIDPSTSRHAHVPAWMVLDSRYVARYSIAGLPVGTVPSWARCSESLDGLAASCGISADGLRATMERFNDDAVLGVDSEFHRGASQQDRHLGDPTNLPNPCLAPVSTPPFYAVRVDPGTLGTCGGIVTDDDGRVLDHAGLVLPGLWAAGNVTASVFGDAYPGGGATLGSALARAYAAGRSLARTLTHPSQP